MDFKRGSGYQESGGRVPEHQDIRETKDKKLFNLIPDILISTT
jgi:hypothetical protein